MKWVIDRYRRFCEWAKQPYRVAPNSTQRHVCSTCATCFEGNYCPRCGQSARIGRYSFRNAFLLFLDVWGLGNRGMFRSVRDLMLRPGYMIRDYLSGMQMAYYPPFKMLFLIGALSLLVETGLNVEGVNRAQMSRQNDAEYLEREKAKANSDASLTDVQKYVRKSVNEYFVKNGIEAKRITTSGMTKNEIKRAAAAALDRGEGFSGVKIELIITGKLGDM